MANVNRSTSITTEVRERWWAAVLFVLTAGLLMSYFVKGYDVVLSLAAITTTDPFFVAWPSLNSDSTLFQHGGWYLTQGAVPYVDFWDVKPPLVFFLTAALASLSNGNVIVIYLFSGVVSGLAIIGSVVLTGAVVHEATDESVAALAAGSTVLVLPYVYTYPMHGIRAKYFVLAFGMASLYLMLRDYPAAGGACAAIAAGFWQFGAVFFILVVGMAFQHDDNRSLSRVVGGGGMAVAAVVILPFVLWGALIPIAVETVIVPFYSPNQLAVLGHIYNTAEALGYATVLILFAIYGWIQPWASSENSSGTQWWITVGGVLFCVQVLLFDGEGWPDVMPLLLFIALGVGVVVASQPSSRQWAIVGLIGLLIVAGPVWAESPSAPLRQEFRTVQQHYPADNGGTDINTLKNDIPSMQSIYWQKIKPESCHYRLSRTEVRWIQMTEAEINDSRCGQWPFNSGF